MNQWVSVDNFDLCGLPVQGALITFEQNSEMDKQLLERSGGVCELCSSDNGLGEYLVSPQKGNVIDHTITACSKCRTELASEQKDVNHWRCLNDSMWSEVDAVKVVAYRVLHELSAEGWPRELLDMMYMDDDILEWAKDGIDDGEKIVHKDSNGAVLNAGDSVVAIKDLNVKGSSMVVKRGTAIRNITLVHDNAEQIEGKVDGQRIVILTKYIKK